MSDLNLFQRLLKIEEEIGPIDKSGKNTMQGYAFTEHAEVVATIRPLMVKHGVMILPEMTSRNSERFQVTRSNGKQGTDIHVDVTAKYTIVNVDKPDDRIVLEWDGGEAIDSSDKATNKAITANEKTFLMKLFKISDREDADQSSPEVPQGQPATREKTLSEKIPATPQQKVQIKELFEKKGVAAEDMAGHIVLMAVDPKNMTKADAQEVINQLTKELVS